MRRASGSHNLRRLRELLGLKQKPFADVLDVSKSLLQKLEHEQAELTQRMAQNIADCTGVSPGWLLRNNPRERPTTANGKRYSKTDFHRAQFRRLDLWPTAKPPILVRWRLLQRYAEMRDLFLRPQMRRHLIPFVIDLQLLIGRYELKAKYPALDTGADIARRANEREKPDNLFPGVIGDAERCLQAANEQAQRREREEAKAAALTRKRREREEAKQAKRVAAFIPQRPAKRPSRIRRVKSKTRV